MFPRFFTCLMPVFILGGPLGLIAHAQMPQNQYEESTFTGEGEAAQIQDPIIVTGRALANEKFSGTKTLTPLVDVPQSLSIITGEQITSQAFRSIEDITRFTPGLSIGQGEGHRDQITIRGQNTTADFFLDGLRDDVQYFRPLYNLEQVEILRGANALIFGRGGGGGIVNRVSKKPVLKDNFTGLEVGMNTFGSGAVMLDDNRAVSDEFAMRLNAYYERLDNHRDVFEGDRFAINPKAKVQISPDTHLVLSYEYVDDDRIVDRGIPSVNGAPLKGFDETFFGSSELNRTSLQAHIARARLDHQVSDQISFNTILQYADYDKLYQNIYPVGIDLGANTLKLDGYRDETGRQNFIVQSNLVADFTTGFAEHTLLFGFEYGNQSTQNTRKDAFFKASEDDQIEFAFSDPVIVPEVGFPEFTRTRASDVKFLSFYAQDQIDLTDTLKLIAGVRFDRFDFSVENADASILASNGGQALTLERVDEEISPRLGLIYKPLEHISFYASWAKSFLPRSGDQFLVLTPSSSTLDPLVYDNYEVGAKWDISPQLAFTASLFQLDVAGGTVIDPANPENLLIIGSRTQGFEAQILGRIQPDWSFNASYSYLDAKERGRVVDAGVDNRVLSQVPEHMVALWSRYDLNSKWGFGLGLTYQSEQFASLSNAVSLPDYTRMDAALYYNLTEDIGLQLNIENLLDAEFFPAAHNDNNISPAAPFNARLTLSYVF